MRVPEVSPYTPEEEADRANLERREYDKEFVLLKTEEMGDLFLDKLAPEFFDDARMSFLSQREKSIVVQIEFPDGSLSDPYVSPERFQQFCEDNPECTAFLEGQGTLTERQAALIDLIQSSGFDVNSVLQDNERDAVGVNFSAQGDSQKLPELSRHLAKMRAILTSPPFTSEVISKPKSPELDA